MARRSSQWEASKKGWLAIWERLDGRVFAAEIKLKMEQ